MKKQAEEAAAAKVAAEEAAAEKAASDARSVSPFPAPLMPLFLSLLVSFVFF